MNYNLIKDLFNDFHFIQLDYDFYKWSSPNSYYYLVIEKNITTVKVFKLGSRNANETLETIDDLFGFLLNIEILDNNVYRNN